MGSLTQFDKYIWPNVGIVAIVSIKHDNYGDARVIAYKAPHVPVLFSGVIVLEFSRTVPWDNYSYIYVHTCTPTICPYRCVIIPVLGKPP